MIIKLGQGKKQRDENFQLGWGDASRSPLNERLLSKGKAAKTGSISSINS